MSEANSPSKMQCIDFIKKYTAEHGDTPGAVAIFEAGRLSAETPAPLDAEFFAVLERCGTQEPLQVYDSNSWRRVGLTRRYEEVLIPERQRDGHLSISNTNLLRALVAAFNAMLARRSVKTAVHPDPTGTTREPPHCPTCECGQADRHHGASPDQRKWDGSYVDDATGRSHLMKPWDESK
jgi:hypothetical protein